MPTSASARLPLTCALALGALALAGPARAQCDVTASAGAVVVPGPPVPATAVNGTTYGAFQATATYGSLSASAVVDLPENASENGMNAIAQFNDEITINAPGVPAWTPGTLTAVIDTRGGPVVVQAATGTGVAQGITASYQLSVSLNGGAVHQLNGLHLYNSGQAPPETISGAVPAPGLEQIDIGFPFGVPVTLSGYLLVNSGGSNIIPAGATGTLQADVTVTFDWNGMTSIRDLSGTEYLGTATVTSCSGTDWVGNLATGVADIGPAAPGSRLEGGFPNPFRGSTTIAFSLGADGPVSVELFDISGRRVRTLVTGFRSAGRHSVAWDGADPAGRAVPGGVYFVRLAGRDGADQEKIVFLK